MPIYTKKGDKGETYIYHEVSGKRRISKDSSIIKVLGSIDELNSFLGVTISFSNSSETSIYLKEIQKCLLIIGSIIAGSKLRFEISNTKNLEKIIDKLEKNIPPLKNFIFPGGTVLASHIQYARSLTRKSEREIVSFSKSDKVKPQILSYLNRLSDFLFVLARNINFEAGISEEIWSEKVKEKKV